MTTLRLYLRPGWPDSEPGLPWALLNARGEPAAQGDSAPGGWPKAEHCELVLPAGRTLFTDVKLPDAVKQPAAAVVGFALEERLGNDPAANLYALGDNGADGRRAVAVTEAASVRRAVAMLKQLGRLCDRIVPEECLMPAPAADGWSVTRLADRWLVRAAAPFAASLPLGGALLEQHLFASLMAASPPASLRLSGVDSVDEVLSRLPGWQGEASRVDRYDWRSGRRQGAFDFAQGELAANRLWRDWAPSFKRAGWLLGMLVVAQLALTLGQSGWYAWQKHSLSQRIVKTATPWIGGQALPGSSALPMLRAVDRLRLSHGQAARDDMVELMGALAAVAGRDLQVRTLEYESGRLKLQVADVPPEALARWRKQLEARQILLDAVSSQPGAKQLVIAREP
ncbi:type II secretion system protein GspL [Chromobacterium sp. IIBBL 290-4]|uniref:type II secretion system protein GspL n=1 Tax=Chromobacterium sp. IIBBL 290-4 TaxID=2953890 RepID=UPI0020B85C91|nr:type II secretion system protein GspL [Chromobacterium sp. IIBBL 290-4]UTH72284.1 type II secretion system protein GspL [Chromobacterium sp. IIBBL 290-4]